VESWRRVLSRPSWGAVCWAVNIPAAVLTKQQQQQQVRCSNPCWEACATGLCLKLCLLRLTVLDSACKCVALRYCSQTAAT
jgi:hypothetical protein